MPEYWDADVYRRRAAEWQTRAVSLPAGPEKDTCVELAEGYARLAHLIAARGLGSGAHGGAERSGAGENAVTPPTGHRVVCSAGTVVCHAESLETAIRLACELERDGHTVVCIDRGASTALEGENLRMAIGRTPSL